MVKHNIWKRISSKGRTNVAQSANERGEGIARPSVHLEEISVYANTVEKRVSGPEPSEANADHFDTLAKTQY